MKKKRNFLTIISSILGVLTICSFSMFSIFSRSDKKASGVDAITNVVIQESSRQNSYLTYTSQSYGVVTVHYNALGQFVKFYNGDNVSYGVYYRFEFYFDFTYLNNQYFVYDSSYDNNFSLSYTHMLDNGNQYNEFEYAGFIKYVDFYQNPLGQQILKLSMGSRVYEFGTDVEDLVFYDLIFDRLGTPITYLNGNVVNLRLVGASSPLDNLDNFININVSFIHDEGIYVQESDVDIAFDDGYTAGYSDGYNSGFIEGQGSGLDTGYQQGYQAGVDSQQPLIENAYQNGYSNGFQAADTQDEVVTSIFSGILQVAMVPINFFLGIFNFEILGINLSAFIRAIFTVVLTIIVIKTVMGKGGGASDN